jgi:hypothetical protein
MITIGKRGKKPKSISISLLEIILLITSIVAFSHLIGQEFQSVSAEANRCINPNGDIWKQSGDSWTCIGGFSTNPDRCQTGQTLTKTDLCTKYSNLNTPLCDSNVIKNAYNVACPSTTTPQPTQAQNIPVPAVGLPDIGNVFSGGGGQAAAEQAALDGFAGGVPGSTAAEVAAAEASKNAINPIFGVSVKKAIGHILQTAAIAAAIYVGSKFFLNKIVGLSPAFAEAAATGLTAGYVFHEIGLPILNKLVGLSLSGPAGWLVSLGVAVLVFVFTYKEVKFEQVVFTCNPWVAPFGGNDCGRCNSQDFPCTEYQCKSLGQGCMLINSGTQDALCVWNNSQDIAPPIISPWDEILTVGYRYAPDTAASTTDKGVKVINENSADGCIEPNSRITIGISLNEPAICKISEKNANSYENMENIFWSGAPVPKFTHSYTFSQPTPKLLESQNITLQNGGELEVYTRCIDSNGKSNIGSFVFRGCVGKTDLTEPRIYATSIFNNSPIGFQQTSADVRVYVDEPVDCKWSRISQDYDAMENPMECEQTPVQFAGQIVWPCSTTLTGLNDYPAANDYFFKCRDQPELKGTAEESDRRTNGESYLFRLLGSRDLVITKIEPNGTISDSTNVIKVTLKAETFAGSNEGEALCYFSATEDGNFGQFFKTGTNKHSQDFYLPEGDYTYYVRCIDSGGNSDQSSTSFTVDSDTESPVIVRAYHEGNFLNIITDEEASCVYSATTQNACNYLFEDGIPMTSLEANKHQTVWNAQKTYYIKCMDDFGNPPSSNACSIVVRPFEG